MIHVNDGDGCFALDGAKDAFFAWHRASARKLSVPSEVIHLSRFESSNLICPAAKRWLSSVSLPHSRKLDVRPLFDEALELPHVTHQKHRRLVLVECNFRPVGLKQPLQRGRIL